MAKIIQIIGADDIVEVQDMLFVVYQGPNEGTAFDMEVLSYVRLDALPPALKAQVRKAVNLPPRSEEDRLTKEDVMDALKKVHGDEPLPECAEALADDIAHFEKVGWPKL